MIFILSTILAALPATHLATFTATASSFHPSTADLASGFPHRHSRPASALPQHWPIGLWDRWDRHLYCLWWAKWAKWGKWAKLIRQARLREGGRCSQAQVSRSLLALRLSTCLKGRAGRVLVGLCVFKGRSPSL